MLIPHGNRRARESIFRVQALLNSLNARLRLFLQGTFPNPQDAPTGAAQGLIDQLIALFVARQLPPPERTIVLRLGFMFGAGVPETAVNEDCRARFEKNKIRPDGETRDEGRVSRAGNYIPLSALGRGPG